MDGVLLAARLLFVAIFLRSGVNHFQQRENMAAYARAYRVPAAGLLVPLTGLMTLGGGVLVGVGLWADLGALLIAAFLAPTAWFIHGFWREQDPQTRMNQEAHFLKNVSMIGGALALFYLFNRFSPQIGLTIGDGRALPVL